MKIGFDITKKHKEKAQASQTRRRKWSASGPMLSFLFFLFLAFAFWFVQNLQRDVARMVYVPLSTESVGLDDTSREELPSLIAVSLQDRTIQHILYRLGTFSPIPLRAYKDASGRTTHIGIDAKDLEEELRNQFATSSKILQIRPEFIRIDLTNRISKIVPVRLGEMPKIAEGYTIEGIKLTPDSVQIFGADDVVAPIKIVYTKPFGQDTKMAQSQTLSLPLDIPSKVSSKIGAISAHITVEPLVERTYHLPIHPQGEPEDYRLYPLPNTAKLTITIPISKIESPLLADLRLVVDLTSLEGKATTDEEQDNRLSVALENAPEWVKRIRLEPSSVQYVLERK